MKTESQATRWPRPSASSIRAATGWTSQAGASLSRTKRQNRPITTCVMCGPRKIAPILQGPFVLPVPENVPIQNIEIHTLRFGDPPWMKECTPTLDAWCARHGLPLKITTTWDKSYPDPKFCEVDMLKSFLAGEAEWMFYVDADIVVHELAPRPYFSEPGYYLRRDRYNFTPRRKGEWEKWCAERFGERPRDGWIYRNAGVWACDRKSAEQMLSVIKKPYHSGIMEQHHWNWFLYQAEMLAGLEVRDLPLEWNRIPGETAPGWMFHIYAKNKFTRLREFREAGVLPDAITRPDKLPETIPNFGEGAVVWPFKSTSEKWGELWFSYQSVIRHWSEKGWPLVLLGDAKPSWWPGEFISAPSYEEALWIGTQCAERVLWMNDDIFLLADQSPETFTLARHAGDESNRLGHGIASANRWRRGRGQILMRLHHMGKPTFDFSTHTPYLFEREKSREIFDRFGLFWKMAFETAYHNFHESPRAELTEKAGPSQIGATGKLWLNVQEGSPCGKSVAKELTARFGAIPDKR